MQKKAYWAINPIIFGDTNGFYCKMWKILSKKWINHRKIFEKPRYQKH